MVTHWVCNVALGQTFMSVVDSYGISTAYTFFGIVSLLGVAYISAAVPETKVRRALFSRASACLAREGIPRPPPCRPLCTAATPCHDRTMMHACTDCALQGKSFDQIQKELAA
jgi:hypothetical protein